MTDPASSDATVREQAADWIVRLGDALDDAERHSVQAACTAWCEQDERHARTFRQMQQMWQATAQPAKPRRGKKGAAAATLCVAALALWWLLPMQRWLADVRVAPGEIRQVLLDDGSRLTLDSGASVDIRFDGETREVHLYTGRLLADVAPDPHGRIFRIIGRDGTARALGTRYIVDQQAADTTVSVLESTVAVATRVQPERPVSVPAGQQVRYTGTALDSPVPLASATASEAWAQGQLVFNAAPLAQVVAELARHRRGMLTLRQPEALAGLRFTGVLPLRDSDAALRILTQSLPLSRGQATAYVVWLEPRQAAPAQ